MSVISPCWYETSFGKHEAGTWAVQLSKIIVKRNPFVMFRGLICRWMNIYWRKTVRRRVEQVSLSIFHLLSSQLRLWDYTNNSFQHSQISIFVFISCSNTVSQPSIKTVPQHYLIYHYQQHLCYSYEWLCLEFPIKAKIFALQSQNINPGTSNSPPIQHYWWIRKHMYYNNMKTWQNVSDRNSTNLFW